MGKGAWDEARDCFAMARKTGAEGADVLLRLGILGPRMGDLELSQEPLDKLLRVLGLPHQRTLETVDHLADLFQEMGEALEGKGERALAAEAYGIAAELDPKRIPLVVRAGKELVVQGDIRGAASQLAEVLKRAPCSPGVLEEIDGILKALEAS
jgi:tetratricopeptide (TPR) repeat protein